MLNDIEIAGWLKSSFIDFPETVATVIFLSGCNLRCPYCHNPGIVNNAYGAVNFDEIREHLIRRMGVIEGVVVSGGEPTLHAGLPKLCDALKVLSLRVKIDTNGLEPERIIVCDFDYLALDVKTSLKGYARLNAPYRDCAERLGQSVDIVKSMGDYAEVRVTAVPGIVDRDDIRDLCAELRGVRQVFIQQFEPNQQLLDPGYESIKPYPVEELELWQNMFLDAGIDECDIRGV
jgi:pyruvate formate lyase activating enzyme